MSIFLLTKINKMVDLYSETIDIKFINIIGIVKITVGTFYLE